MDRIPVSSSVIQSVGYDPDQGGTLEIEFKDGDIYRYFYVPVSVYDGLMKASSLGTYFNQQIRDRFTDNRSTPRAGGKGRKR